MGRYLHINEHGKTVMSTPAGRKGIKEGDSVVYLGDNIGEFKTNDIIVLRHDDGTEMPSFKNLSGDESWYILLSQIKTIDQGNQNVSTVNYQELAIRTISTLVEQYHKRALERYPRR